VVKGGLVGRGGLVVRGGLAEECEDFKNDGGGVGRKKKGLDTGGVFEFEYTGGW